MLNFFVYILLVFAILFLSAGWALLGYWQAGLFLLLLIPVSLVLLKLKFLPICSLVLTLSVLLSALGLWRGFDISLALAGVLSALAAWDLEGFSHRLALVPAEDNPLLVERRHLLGLGLILLLGSAINFLSFSMQFVFSFEWAVVLVVATFIGIGALVNWLRNRES
jgi:hypothetical protein